VAEVDRDLLDVLLKLQRIHAETWPWHPAVPAIMHAMETVAALSSGLEQLAAEIQANGPDNPSFN
jgi:hypothetical protein